MGIMPSPSFFEGDTLICATFKTADCNKMLAFCSNAYFENCFLFLANIFNSTQVQQVGQRPDGEKPLTNKSKSWRQLIYFNCI